MQARCRHDMLFGTKRHAGYANLNLQTNSSGEQMHPTGNTSSSAVSPTVHGMQHSSVASPQSMSEGSASSHTGSRGDINRPNLFTAHAQAIGTLPDKRPDPSVAPVNSAKRVEMGHLARMYDVTKEKIKAYTANHHRQPPEELRILLNFILYQNEKLRQIDREPMGRGPFANEFAEVKRAYNDLLSRLEFDTSYYSTGCAKEGWDLLAGFMAFVLCFSPGTMMSVAYKNPWLLLLIAPAVWTFGERLPPTVRATSWKNANADEIIPKFMKMQERRARDWVRSWRASLAKRQKVYPWTDPGAGQSRNLTAAQYLKKIEFFSAWIRKYWTDDLVYFWYTAMYGSRYTLLTHYTTPAFLATPQGFAVSMLTLFTAGGTAGALTMFSMQKCRRFAYEKAHGTTNGGAILTRSRAVWTAATIATEKDIALLKKKAAKPKEAHESIGVAEYRKCLKDEKKRAVSKSSFLSSIAYEIRPLLQTKRRRDDAKGEVAGKRIETVSGFIAKNIALLPVVLFAEYVTQPYVEKSEQVPEHLMWIQYFLLIVGFSGRKEFEIVGRVLSGLLFGLRDVIRDCRGLPDDEEAVEVTTQMPRDQIGGKSDDADHEPAVRESYRSGNLEGEQSDDDGSTIGTPGKVVSLNTSASSPDIRGTGSRRTRGSRARDDGSPYAPRPGKKLSGNNDSDNGNDSDNPLPPNKKERSRQKDSGDSAQTPIRKVSTAKNSDTVIDMRSLQADAAIAGRPDSSDSNSPGSAANSRSKERTHSLIRQTTGTDSSHASFKRKQQRKNRVAGISSRSDTNRSSESSSSKIDNGSSATQSSSARTQSKDRSDSDD
jgi:hypothetical protein